jgi:hypothetical protein
MSNQKQLSLGDLGEIDPFLAFDYLRGTPWEEIFEVFEQTPPQWLVDWSSMWRGCLVFTIDEIDPYVAEYILVFDSSCNETWAAIHQGDNQVVMEAIQTRADEPDADVICDFFLNELGSLGSLLFGDFRIHAPQWLPIERVEPFMKKRMEELSQTLIYGLSLPEWLIKQYGHPSSE